MVPQSAVLLDSALARTDSAFRPSTSAAHLRHLRTYMAFLVFLRLPFSFSIHNLLIFGEYLYTNNISYKVVKQYFSSLQTSAAFYAMNLEAFSHPLLSRFIRSISINSQFSPSPKGIFDIKTLYLISLSCDILPDPLLFRAIFLVAFYGFVRMSNFAPHSLSKFDPLKHFLKKDLIFGPPGAHLIMKWSKTLQSPHSHHIIQLPSISNIFLCPVRALRALINSRPLSDHSPLFAHAHFPHNQVIDTVIRDALKTVLTHRGFPTRRYSFHTFRRSGASFAFDHNVQIQNIMYHGTWRSSAVWSDIQQSSHSSSIVPLTFAQHVPSFL